MGNLKFDFGHINQTKEFKYIYINGFKVVTNYFVVFFVNYSNNVKKVAVVASKKIGNAVLRNRAKRRMRELLRLSKSSIKNGVGIIMIAKKPVLNTKFNVLQEAFYNSLEIFYKHENNKHYF